ncbi:MAG: MT-A70 family methyltransferase [Magnetospiraceae bacterium]
MTSWPFGSLSRGTYQVVLADPPWRFATYSEAGQQKCPTYNTMTTPDIALLPVADLAARHCLLLMWTTTTHLEDALWVMMQWGFGYVGAGFWHKKTAGGKTALGTGYWWRGAGEFLLLGKRGNPPCPRKFISNVIESFDTGVLETTRGRHSEKPEEIQDLVDGLAPLAIKCELFARRHRPGWECWGDQLPEVRLQGSEGDKS